jgi:hypothetical protein
MVLSSDLSQCGVLPLRLALGLLLSRALALEGGLSILEGGPLLLELALHFLMCAPLLAKLLLHRGERRDLLLQVRTQFLDLLAFCSA